jgi:methylated-DNA-[protein]-cysteine S-methyltransferase
MTPPNFTLFETAIGPCGIAWSDTAIYCTQLPEGDETRSRARMQKRVPGASEAAPPASVRAAIERIVALFDGARDDDLADVALDMTRLPAFNREVYAIARKIPPGATMTYGEIAKRLGGLELSRDVGQALGKNPFPIIVPCHRVLAAGAKPGGFSARGGTATKLKMLAIEGAYVNHTPSLFGDEAGARAPLAAALSPPYRT